MENIDLIANEAEKAGLSQLLVTSKNKLRAEVSQLVRDMRSCQSQGSYFRICEEWYE